LDQRKEIELAQKIAAGKSAEQQHAKLNGAMTAVASDELKIAIETGKLAKRAFIEGNLRLVVNVAKKYPNQGLDLIDRIQEGNIGLFRAVDKFDPNKGKFSTYAILWIREAITSGINKRGRTIYLPVEVNRRRREVEKRELDITQEIGYRPSINDLAEDMSLSPKMITDLKSYSRQQLQLSLNKSIGDPNGELTLEGQLADPKVDVAEEVATGQLLKEQVKDMLGALTEREQKILKLRFGLEDGKQHTLEEVGQEFAVTRERIRQIEAKALAKLRKHKDARKLHDYIK
jgi:RNA polymerase primary sigma factor